jgi:LPXTG-site transpeptidase (sortase) family protein
MATKSKKILKKNNLTIRWKRILGRILISSGIFTILVTIFLTQMAYISPNKQTVVLNKSTVTTNTPSTIRFNNTTFKLEKGTFQYGLWPLSDSNPVYLETSGNPDQPGNIIIYGHNTPKIFGSLSLLEEGSEVTLTTNHNTSLIYKIDTVKKVFPQNVEILQQGSEERLTLFTCTGLFDSMRLVVSGKRI